MCSNLTQIEGSEVDSLGSPQEILSIEISVLPAYHCYQPHPSLNRLIELPGSTFLGKTFALGSTIQLSSMHFSDTVSFDSSSALTPSSLGSTNSSFDTLTGSDFSTDNKTSVWVCRVGFLILATRLLASWLSGGGVNY